MTKPNERSNILNVRYKKRKPSITCWNTSSTSSNNIVY
nr:MAG TPA: hypothetical protein [Caudoviricetes sp.]